APKRVSQSAADREQRAVAATSGANYGNPFARWVFRSGDPEVGANRFDVWSARGNHDVTSACEEAGKFVLVRKPGPPTADACAPIAVFGASPHRITVTGCERGAIGLHWLARLHQAVASGDHPQLSTNGPAQGEVVRSECGSPVVADIEFT